MESLDSRIWGFQQKSLISAGLTIKPQEMVLNLTLVKGNEDGNLKVEFGPCSMGNKCRERCPGMMDSRTPGVLSNWAGFPQSPWLLCQHLFCQLLLLPHFLSLWESHKAPSLSSPLLSLSLILQYLPLLTWGQSHPCADNSPIHFSTPALLLILPSAVVSLVSRLSMALLVSRSHWPKLSSEIFPANPSQPLMPACLALGFLICGASCPIPLYTHPPLCRRCVSAAEISGPDSIVFAGGLGEDLRRN